MSDRKRKKKKIGNPSLNPQGIPKRLLAKNASAWYYESMRGIEMVDRNSRAARTPQRN